MVKRKSVSKRRSSKKRVSKKRSSKKRVSKKRVSKRRSSKKRVSKKRVSKKRVSKKRVSKKRVSKRRSSRKQKKNLLRGGGAEECSNIQKGRVPIERRQDVSDQSYYTKNEFVDYYEGAPGIEKYNSIDGSEERGYICEADDEVRFNTKLGKWVTKDEFTKGAIAMWHASQQRDEANDSDDDDVPAPPPYASADAPPSPPKDVVLSGGESLSDFGVGGVINGVYNYNPVLSEKYGDVFTHIVKDVFDAASWGKEFHIFCESSGYWTIGNTKNLTGGGEDPPFNIGLSTNEKNAIHPASLTWQLKSGTAANITVDIAP
jgi:hypothetical protein